MALAVLLLVGAGLMLRSLWSLQRIPIGFDPSNVLTMRVSLPAASYASPEQVVGFYERLLDRVRQLPGVRSSRRGAAAAARLDDRRLRPDGRRLRSAAGHEREGRLADCHRRLPRSDGRAARARPHDHAGGYRRQPARRARQRGAGAALLCGTGSDRRAPEDRGRPEAALGHRRRHRRRRPPQRDHRGHQGKVLCAAPAVAQVHRESDPQHGARREDVDRSVGPGRADPSGDSQPRREPARRQRAGR